MTQEQRAKQFMPFDAMKGLQEALRDREEKHLRVEKHGLADEDIEKNIRVISGLECGMSVEISCYRHFHDVCFSGIVSAVSIVYRYLIVDDEKIFFDDIYNLKVID